MASHSMTVVRQQIRLMLREEFRLQTAFSSKFGFLTFPVLIAIFAFVFASASAILFKNIAQRDILLLLHGGMMLYGVSTGAFGLIGEEILERRFGQVNLLLSSPLMLPLKFKHTMLAFYIKDLIYYLFLSIAPIGVGLIASIPLSGFRLTSVLLLLAMLTLTFLLGISFCFLLTTVYARVRWLGGTVLGLLGVVILGSIFLHWFPIDLIFPAMRFQETLNPVYLLINVALIALFSFLAILFTRERFEPVRSMAQTATFPRVEERFRSFRSYSPLLAKEFVDLKRSGTIQPIIFSFVGPLIFLWIITWFLNTGLGFELEFNLVFYGGMIGFLGMMIYSWLNNIDTFEFLDSLPVSVPKVIRAKLIVYVMLTSGITLAYIIVLAIVNQQLNLLFIGLLVAFTTSMYVVIATAFLTGLRTNTYLFNASILGRFALMTVVPLIAVTILSLIMNTVFFVPALIVAGLSVGLGVLAYWLYLRIEKRWAREEFRFA